MSPGRAADAAAIVKSRLSLSGIAFEGALGLMINSVAKP
jgi:hypothetical protein